MTYFEYTERIKRMDLFIRSENTGTAQELSQRLGVCRRTIFDDLQYIKNKGADIAFSKFRKTYYYANKFVLIF